MNLFYFFFHFSLELYIEKFAPFLKIYTQNAPQNEPAWNSYTRYMCAREQYRSSLEQK